jgi:hypothetical protein
LEIFSVKLFEKEDDPGKSGTVASPDVDGLSVDI